MLPEIISVKMPDLNFPTVWQAVIFRNYGIVSNRKIAETIECDEQTVETEALRLGLEKTEYDEKWARSGYITIIRNNWFLLPYEQLMKILDFTEEKLEFCLKEEDFLSAKLGKKPQVSKVVYEPLNKEQITQTEELASVVKTLQVKTEKKAFDFFSCSTDKRTFDFGKSKSTKIVHGYLTPCGDALIGRSEEYLPDSLLEEYQRQGINGLWMHGVLSALSPYPYKPALSEKYKERREELKRLIKRCQKYGIKIYLYFNEPRYLPEKEFGKYSHLMGFRENGKGSFCLSKKEVQEYLYNAFKDFVSDVKDLGGIITITMSENQTHCYCYARNTCSCKDVISKAQTVALVNNIIAKAVKDSGAKTEVLANLWGWSKLYGFKPEEIDEAIDLLDKDISIISVSEYGLDLNKGGVKVGLIDYSISNPGPSPEAKAHFARAKMNGHKIYAKIQANNSWECSCVPWLPAFDLVKRHLDSLSENGVSDYMLCWTLGGYPSPCLNLVAAYEQGKTLDEWYNDYYGADAPTVRKAVKHICDGFENYPFTVYSLYYSPCTLGPANMWSIEPEEKKSAMVGFTYDDYGYWTTPYPVEIYLSLYEKLLSEWGEGVRILKEAKRSPLIDELLIMAEVAYLHFKSSVNQTKYSWLKKDLKGNKDVILGLIKDEKQTAKTLIGLVAKDCRVGYEASNHYFYTQNSLKEKVLNLNALQKKIEQL